MRFIVTVKDKKNPNHDPRNKVENKCRWSEWCTDSTGEHHSFLLENFDGISDVEVWLDTVYPGVHITRIELVSWLMLPKRFAGESFIDNPIPAVT